MNDDLAIAPAHWRRFYLAWAVLACIVAAIQATSQLMEAAAIGRAMPTWKPFVTEYSSLAAYVAVLPLLRRFDKAYPFRRDGWEYALLAHAPFTVIYAMLMVGGFWILRAPLYALFGSTFEPDVSWTAFLYEYRKLLVGYVAGVFSLYAFRHYMLLQQLLAMPEAETGSAAPMMLAGPERAGDAAAEGEPGPASRPPEGEAPAPEPAIAPAAPPRRTTVPITRFIARANHREYVVQAEDIEYIEAAGNYSVLHAPGGPFRLRQTIASLEQLLDPVRFARVHRSHIVRIGAIREIQPWYHGDQKLVLHGGAVLNLSRRYRDRLRLPGTDGTTAHQDALAADATTAPPAAHAVRPPR